MRVTLSSTATSRSDLLMLSYGANQSTAPTTLAREQIAFFSDSRRSVEA